MMYRKELIRLLTKIAEKTQEDETNKAIMEIVKQLREGYSK